MKHEIGKVNNNPNLSTLSTLKSKEKTNIYEMEWYSYVLLGKLRPPLLSTKNFFHFNTVVY